MGAFVAVLMDAAGNWRDTFRGLVHNPMRSGSVIIALGALDEATVRLIVAVTESLPPDTFSYPQYALAYQALTLVVTLILCAFSAAGAYLVVSKDSRVFRNVDSETPRPSLVRWMWRSVLGWCLIVTFSAIFSVAVQFVAMWLGIEGYYYLGGIYWLFGILYALLQALLAAFVLLRVPEAIRDFPDRHPGRWSRRRQLFASYVVLFLSGTLLMYLVWWGDQSVSTAWNLRSYYFLISLITVLSLLLSCSAARRFADRPGATATVFD